MMKPYFQAFVLSHLPALVLPQSARSHGAPPPYERRSTVVPSWCSLWPARALSRRARA